MTHFAARQFLGAVHAGRKEQAVVMGKHIYALVKEIVRLAGTDEPLPTLEELVHDDARVAKAD